MTTIVKDIYEAFIEAGASKETAGRVADSLNESFERVVRKDDAALPSKGDIHAVRDDIALLDKRLCIVEAELKNIKWLIGGVGFPLIVGMIATVIGVFFGG